jgi:hypothetical protein
LRSIQSGGASIKQTYIAPSIPKVQPAMNCHQDGQINASDIMNAAIKRATIAKASRALRRHGPYVAQNESSA